MQETDESSSAEPMISAADKHPVLIELFTSEGCSSCPPADKVLAFLDREPVVPNAEIIALGLHVDYWDRLGWRDRFSSNEYTRRQEAYARQFKLDSTYTPQMVVDGATELIGSNSGAAVNAVTKSTAAVKGIITIAKADGQLHINIDSLPQHNGANVYLAVAEGKLTSNVSSGENSGSRLEHVAVVRQLNQIGSIPAGQASLTIDQRPPADPDWKAQNLKYVVFVQNAATLQILAAAQSK